MTIRWAKILLLAAIGLNYALVVFDNLTDFGSNYQFVRHVLMMDSTLPGNHGMWRAISMPGIHLVFYWLIIAWEAASAWLLWRALCNSSAACAALHLRSTPLSGRPWSP